MKTKNLIPLAVGLVVGVVAIKYTMDQLDQAKGSPQPSNWVTVVLSRQDIPSHSQIEPDMLIGRESPATPLLPADAFSSVADLVGRVSMKNIPQGVPILPTMIAPEGTPPGLRVPDGYRAVAVKIDESSGVGYLVKPGDWVDVFAVMDDNNRGRRETVSKIVLQRVQVGAVGQAVHDGNEDTNGRRAQTVTLLTRTSDVTKLHLAQTRGRITLAMRGQEDDKIVKDYSAENARKKAEQEAADQTKGRLADMFNNLMKQPPADAPQVPAPPPPRTVAVINSSGSDGEAAAITRFTFDGDNSMRILSIDKGAFTPDKGKKKKNGNPNVLVTDPPPSVGFRPSAPGSAARASDKNEAALEDEGEGEGEGDESGHDHDQRKGERVMKREVKDDPMFTWQPGRLLTALTLLLAGQVTVFPATAQDSAGLSITVKEASIEMPPHVTVPLNGSVIIETSKPVARVQVVESSIARIEPISPKQYMLKGIGYGRTQLLLWSEDGERQAVEIYVELDLSLLNEKLKDIDPQSTAEAVAVRGNILLTGTVSGAHTAERIEQFATLFIPPGEELAIQNHMLVAGQQQVLIRCTVAEVARSALKELGVNGFLAGDNFHDAFAVSQIGGVNPINIGAGADVNVLGAIPFLTGENGIPLSPATTFSIGFPDIQMQLFIKALSQNALLRVMAEPNLVTISGETASFLAGGEFPIPVPQAGASAGAVTIQFREFGVRVNFTPQVLAHQMIRLRIAPEVSELDFSSAVQISGLLVPGLTQRRVETTVEVGSGQTLALAGLLSEEVRAIAQNLPGLGEVPVLGALFRSVEYRRRQSELVFLVTPEIIAPMHPQQVPKVPGEDYATPNDYELYALGLLEGQMDESDAEIVDPAGVYETGAQPKVAPRKSEPDALSLHGPWGYTEEGGF